MGWVGLLVVGVAIQVLPMFYITSAYPAPMRRWFAPAVLIGKILPLLTWFHLQHRQVGSGRFDLRIPHMGRLLSTR